MLRSAFLGLGVIFAIHLSGSPARAAVSSCQGYLASATAAATRIPPDFDALNTLRQQVNNSSICLETQKTCFAYFVADIYAREADRVRSSGGQLGPAEQLVAKGAQVGKTWRVLWAAASFAEERKDFDKAALYYKSALTEIAEVESRIRANEQRSLDSFVCEGEKENLPNRDQTGELIRLAEQADLLSKSFVPAPLTRDGSMGGIFIGTIRGIEITQFPIPIEFVYDKVELTPKGKDAMATLVNYLNRRALERVVLTGHADSHGSEQYNCDLSARRLNALVAALKPNLRNNVALEVIPQGKGEPFQVVEGSSFTPDQIDQLNRRVVLRDRPSQIDRKCR
jgi:outer membrane protein OmpA-like peptidoglycan-associated protein